MELLCVQLALRHLHDHLIESLGMVSEHGVSEFLIGNHQSERLNLFVEKSLGDELLEHLLLEDSLIHFLTLGLGLLAGHFHLLLEFLYINRFSVDFRHGGTGAEQCAARVEEVTDDEGQKGRTDDNEQKH